MEVEAKYIIPYFVGFLGALLFYPICFCPNELSALLLLFFVFFVRIALKDEDTKTSNSATSTSTLSTMVMSELECPVCTSMMVGQFHQPLFCQNGHPCCTSCSTRVSRCPSCRSSGGWSRCLPMERVGTWLLDRRMVTRSSPPPPLTSTPSRGRTPSPGDNSWMSVTPPTPPTPYFLYSSLSDQSVNFSEDSF